MSSTISLTIGLDWVLAVTSLIITGAWAVFATARLDGLFEYSRVETSVLYNSIPFTLAFGAISTGSPPLVVLLSVYLGPPAILMAVVGTMAGSLYAYHYLRNAGAVFRQRARVVSNTLRAWRSTLSSALDATNRSNR